MFKMEQEKLQINYEKKYEDVLVDGLKKLKKINEFNKFQDNYFELKLDLDKISSEMIEKKLSTYFLMSKKLLGLEFKLFSLKSDSYLNTIWK